MKSWMLLLLLALATPAQAADLAEAKAEAKKHYAEATKAFRLGEFDRAVDEYRAAYNAVPEPAILYNIAQAYRLAGNLQQAQFFYRSYLNSLPAAENRGEVEERLKTIEERLKAIEEPLKAEKAVTGQPPNTQVPDPRVAPNPSPAPQTTEAPAKAPVEPPRTPLVKRWWLWTAVGVVAAGVALGVGLGVGLNNPGPQTPSSALGSAQVFY